MLEAEFDPSPGVPETITAGLRRVVAPNPSPMTFRGTNTYLLGTRDLAVIDPGPDDSRHLEAIRDALEPGQRIVAILVTHAHLDHSALAPRLSNLTSAPVLAFGDARVGRSETMARLAESGLEGGGEGIDRAFRPDRFLADGEVVTAADWSLRALWTPGHMGNHLSFQWSKIVFTGDVVMGWASSLVSPPDGDVRQFLSSCVRLANLQADQFLPGHGAAVRDPTARAQALISHRQARESQILGTLSPEPATIPELTRQIYHDVPAALLRAAERNVFAHLIDLVEREIVVAVPKLAPDARFRTAPSDRDPQTS